VVVGEFWRFPGWITVSKVDFMRFNVIEERGEIIALGNDKS